MITKRIIPCLDVRSGRVVKGTNFEGIRDVADPVEMARMYNAAEADELVFYDITASFEGRALFTDILTRVASEVFIPLTVGGGINTLEDFDRVLKCGADKVSVNSGALRDPDLIPAAARRYGNQCVVLSADVKRVNGQFRVFAKGGREDTGRDALDWIRWCVDHGAGLMVRVMKKYMVIGTASTPTACAMALIWKCWTLWRPAWTCPSSPAAVPEKKRIFWSCSTTRASTRALRPASSTRSC